MADQDVNIKITAKDTAKNELASLRKELLAIQKQMRETTDPKQLKALESGFNAVSRSVKSAQDALRKANLELAETERRSKGIGRVWDSASSGVERNAAKMRTAGLVMTAALAYFSVGALKSFSSVEDASSALTATFGQTGQEMIDWAQKSGDRLNLAQGEARDALLTYAGYARSAGLMGNELATFSEGLVERSADLASYYGGTTADALQALGAALRGEAEPARRYGVFVDDAALKSEYLNITGQKVNGTLTAQQKIMAAQSLIMKQSSVAAGDMERTQASTANTIKDASQQWADFQSTMGATVAQVAGPGLRALNGMARTVAALPAPLKATALGLGFVAAAALIVTPRIFATVAAMKTAGITAGTLGTKLRGVAGFLGGPWGIAMAGAAIGIGMFVADQQRAKQAAQDFKDTLDAQTGAMTGASRALAAQKLGELITGADEWQKITEATGVSQVGFIDAVLAGGAPLEKLRLQLEGLGSNGNILAYALSSDARMFKAAANSVVQVNDELNDGEDAWKVAIDLAKGHGFAMLFSRDAMEKAAGSAGSLGRSQSFATATADALTRAQKRLAKGLAAADAMYERRSLRRSYNSAVKAFQKDPSAASGDAAGQAALALAGSFKDPKRRAQFVTGAVEEIRTAVNNTSLSSGIKSNIKQPLNESYNEAQKLLGTLRRIAAMEAAIRAASIAAPGAVTAFRADGGLVSGPGSGTSDSIPARLSNGEYVIRAAAVNAIGVGTLNRLNYADRAQARSTDVPVPAGMSFGGDTITAVFNPSSEVDAELMMRRLQAEQDRRRRTRMAKAGR